MSKRAFRLALLTVLVALALLAAAAGWAVREVMSYTTRRHAGAGRQVVVKIARGMRFPEVAGELARAGVIDRPSWLRLYAMHRGLANKVRAGSYTLRDDLSPREVMEILLKGVQEAEVAVTIPEGRNIREVFSILETAGVAAAAELEAVARDPEWLRQQGIDGDTAEGYLFPETYRFKQPEAPRAVLGAMVRQHRVVYEEVRKANARALARLQKQLGWGDREVVILASIVEKETGEPSERPRVASVFYNRLTMPSFTSRRLETDPTIRYGCTIPLKKSRACARWDAAGRLHRAQLDDAENPYNTYQHPDLPPGPISNPGRASLAATMDPERTDFLFFVAKDARSHVFSRTLAEHRRWVDKYQR